jgi:hypothetical protein
VVSVRKESDVDISRKVQVLNLLQPTLLLRALKLRTATWNASSRLRLADPRSFVYLGGVTVRLHSRRLISVPS